MDVRLNGKRALVTGSSAGLGRVTARMLADEGVSVVVHGRAEDRAAAAAESIRRRRSE
ncbi:SDR family NAD(P)-dependent oxidoreductase [Streptomyces wuyuanensis]|uniref:Short chain dehydrogenase n=1 Tax=Streptomyces wuyuanensis TaxID=1196353 RepID=A0A1H0A527_9ACTN|nr:SDR family NAD(P)-dependent oxidoreductase [Streptomyces wuyuanensis]SDN28063.1 short chain dehydrogenase [Streptomyces wuyuanensis]